MSFESNIFTNDSFIMTTWLIQTFLERFFKSFNIEMLQNEGISCWIFSNVSKKGFIGPVIMMRSYRRCLISQISLHTSTKFYSNTRVSIGGNHRFPPCRCTSCLTYEKLTHCYFFRRINNKFKNFKHQLSKSLKRNEMFFQHWKNAKRLRKIFSGLENHFTKFMVCQIFDEIIFRLWANFVLF